MRFASFADAGKFLGVDRRVVGKAVQSGKQIQGWGVRRQQDPPPTAEHPPSDPLIAFVFGEEAAEAFRGKSVRITPDKRVSVYDVIKVVTEVENARDTYSTISSTHPEVVAKTDNFQFPGQGQRPTPVTDIQGMLKLINLLPGANAARFRAGGAKLLVRYMGGDETLVDEVRAIQDHHASGASQGTMGQLFHEEVQAQQA